MSDLLLYFLFCILETARKKAVKQSTDKKRQVPVARHRQLHASPGAQTFIHIHTHTHTHVRIGACVQKVDGVEGERGGALTEKKMKRKTIQGKGKGADNKESWYTSPFPLHRHKK